MSDNDRAMPADQACAPDGVEPDRQSQAKPLVPIALTASGFIYAIAKVFHEHHDGPLNHADAIAQAVGALELIETSECPFGHPDFDWSEDAARDAAREAMRDWERSDG